MIWELSSWMKENLKMPRSVSLKAASMGEAAAAYNLGMMYHFGKGVEIDYDVAREYYEEAVKSDYPLALNNLGSIYYNGHGVRKDIAKSFPYFCRAAERGWNPLSLRLLPCCFTVRSGSR